MEILEIGRQTAFVTLFFVFGCGCAALGSLVLVDDDFVADVEDWGFLPAVPVEEPAQPDAVTAGDGQAGPGPAFRAR